MKIWIEFEGLRFEDGKLMNLAVKGESYGTCYLFPLRQLNAVQERAPSLLGVLTEGRRQGLLYKKYK